MKFNIFLFGINIHPIIFHASVHFIAINSLALLFFVLSILTVQHAAGRWYISAMRFSSGTD
jgi:hypothetical protein